MKLARVLVNTETVGRSSAGLVYTGVAVRVNGFSFPDEHWTDFAVVVLAWWCEGIIKLFSNAVVQQELRFMDGPYLVEISRSKEGTWRMKCLETGINAKECKLDTTIHAKPFVESLVESAHVLLSICDREQWYGDDYEKLKSSAARLRELLMQQPSDIT